MLSSSLQRRTTDSSFPRTHAEGLSCAPPLNSHFVAPTGCLNHAKPFACTTKTTRCQETTYSSSEDLFGNYTSEQSYDIGFTGREWDADIGLYNYRARWYHPKLGKFICEDPAGLSAASPSLYGYDGNNPVNLIDPSGLGAEDFLPNVFTSPSENCVSINSLAPLPTRNYEAAFSGSLDLAAYGDYRLSPTGYLNDLVYEDGLASLDATPTFIPDLASSAPTMKSWQSAPVGQDVSAIHLLRLGRDLANGDVAGGSFTSGQQQLIAHGYELAQQP